MHFLNIESYFGTGMQTVHSVSGYISLTALGVAAVSFLQSRWVKTRTSPEVGLLAHDLPEGLPMPGSESIAVSDGLWDAQQTDDDVEPTVVISTNALRLNSSTSAEPAELRVANEQAENSLASQVGLSNVLLLCQDDVEPDDETSPHARILVTASGVSDRGKKRRINEDCFLLLHDHTVFAVADGMGGYNGGEIASSLAVNTIRESFEHKSFLADLQSNRPLPRLSRELACSLLEANRAVRKLAGQKTELSEMGTTLVAARFSPNKQRVYIGNVGDSRCYRFRSGKLSQLTTDHTMHGLGDEGPTKNQLYRAIGVKQNVDIDIVVDVPQSDDLYLLCSDGLPKMATTDEIESILAQESDLELAAHRLVDFANDAGGRDNVTVVLVRVQDRVGRVDGPVDLASKRRLAQPHALGNQSAQGAVNAAELSKS